jgi:hypothetical protein
VTSSIILTTTKAWSSKKSTFGRWPVLTTSSSASGCRLKIRPISSISGMLARPVQSSQMTGHVSQLALTSSMLALSIVLDLSGEISVSRSSVRRAAGSAISVPGDAPIGGRRVVAGARLLIVSAFAMCSSDVTSDRD